MNNNTLADLSNPNASAHPIDMVEPTEPMTMASEPIIDPAVRVPMEIADEPIADPAAAMQVGYKSAMGAC